MDMIKMSYHTLVNLLTPITTVILTIFGIAAGVMEMKKDQHDGDLDYNAR